MSEDFKLDFDESTLDDNSRPIYESLNKQFRDAWLKKSQGAADERKKLQSELEDIRRSFQEADQERQAFRNWWQMEGQYKYATPEQGAAAEGFDSPSDVHREIQQLRSQFQQAASNYDSVINDLRRQNQVMEGAMRMQQDLWGLRWKHKDKDIDPQRILETAKEKNVSDLNLAYELTYGDEDRRREVDTKVQQRLDEELAKHKAEQAIVETPKSTPRYIPPAQPKTYGEASNGILNAVRSSGGSGTLID